LIARGYANKEIASRLNLSEQTIKNHIHRMLRKVARTTAPKSWRLQGCTMPRLDHPHANRRNARFRARRDRGARVRRYEHCGGPSRAIPPGNRDEAYGSPQLNVTGSVASNMVIKFDAAGRTQEVLG
jgi:uncharacterized protein YjcR